MEGSKVNWVTKVLKFSQLQQQLLSLLSQVRGGRLHEWKENHTGSITYMILLNSLFWTHNDDDVDDDDDNNAKYKN